jgi:hypothetical protein
MSIITKMLAQVAVWWSAGPPDSYGKPTYGEPVEINCRWEDAQEEFINANGELATSRSKVYVDRDVKAGDVLSLGTLDSGVDEDNPKQNKNAWEVRNFSKMPNMRVSEFLRVAYL